MNILSCIIVLFISFQAWALQSVDKHAELLTNTITIDKKVYLAFTIKHEKGWHTYWKNPGDAGLPTKFYFSINSRERKELLVLEWPVPHRYFESGDLLAYGYEEDPTFFAELPAKSYAVLSETPIFLKFELEWLICKDLCIPGKGEAVVKVLHPSDKTEIASSQGSYSESQLKERFLNLPQKAPWPQNLNLYLSKKKDNSLVLHLEANEIDHSQLDQNMNFITPFLNPLLGFKKETLTYDQKNKTLYSQFNVEWDGELESPPRSLPTNGIFSPPVDFKFLIQDTKSKKYFVIEKSLGSFSLTDAGIDQLLNDLNSQNTDLVSKQPGIISFYVFAFLGGLILNLMPCVLPVITLKLFGMIKYQSLSQVKVLKHNLTYTLGVLTTFLILALTIVIIKNEGNSIGWGFQLQSPAFVLLMIFILFVMVLNLFGLFEFQTPGGRFLGNAQVKQGFVGDFLSGVLSTILSTPCSAPFLGTALTFAFTQDNYHIFLIFTFIGLGLSFPFLLTGFFPGWLHLLPKPGAWMEKLKYFLGMTLLVTVIWLCDVFLNIVSFRDWFWPLFSTLGFLFFAFFLQRKVTYTWIKAVFIIPVVIFSVSLQSLTLTPFENKIENTTSQWQPWSPQKLTELQGQWVLMDFTADWCLTCKVNKKLVLDTKRFSEFSDKKHLQLVRGDWTKRDDNITNFLSKYGAVGVPAYFLQNPDGKVEFLGETISIAKIEKFLQKTN